MIESSPDPTVDLLDVLLGVAECAIELEAQRLDRTHDVCLLVQTRVSEA